MPNWFIALRIKASPVSSNSQYSRICAGPTLAQRASAAPRRERRAPHATIFDGAQSPRLLGECRCVGIAGEAAAVGAGKLSLARIQHALPHGFARFARPVRGEFFVIDAQHVDALRVSKRSSSGPEIRF